MKMRQNKKISPSKARPGEIRFSKVLHSTLTNFIVIFAIVLVAFIGLPSARASATNPSPGQCVHTVPPSVKPAKVKDSFGRFEKVRIEFIAPERNTVQLNCNGVVHELSVQDEGWKARLAKFSSGDIVTLSYIPSNGANELREIKTFAVEIPFQKRLETFTTTGVLFFVLAALALWITKGNILAIRELFVGRDKRLSNSKSQAAVWFFALITSYLCLTLLRIQTGGFEFVGGISIPQNLLLLSGLSALTYAGAKAITQDQVNKNPESKIPAADGQAGLGDYLTDDDGNTDFGDFQMTVITLLAVGIFLMQVFNFTSIISLSKNIEIPNLDTTILSLFGISQGAYLSKKAAVASGAKEAEPIVFNAKNSKVRDINKQLNKKLQLTGPGKLNEDGEIYDEFTAEKVLAFQAQMGLPQTGMVDAKTLTKLME